MVIGYRPVVVLSGSMEPKMPVGSIIYYAATTYEEIEVGDIVTYTIRDDSNTMVTHRVLEKNEADRSLIMKGDANEKADVNPVRFSDIKGKTTLYVLPYIGYLIYYIKNYIVIAVILAILVLKSLLDRFILKDEEVETEQEK
jgi:signal peptidase I